MTMDNSLPINCIECSTKSDGSKDCKKCAYQQKMFIFIFCFCFITVVVNVILVVLVISNTNKYQSLQDTVALLKNQVSTIKSQQDISFPGMTKRDFISLQPEETKYHDDASTATHALSRSKRQTHENKQKRTKRNKRKQKRKDYVHVEGTGGQHSPEDRFAGIFHKWQLANWTNAEISGRGIVRTGQKEFLLNLQTGELVIKRKGIYLFYSQVTLMGQPDQRYYVEKGHEHSSSWRKIASCSLSFQHSSGNSENGYNNYLSCSTMGIFEFSFDDKIRLRHSNKGGVIALFDANASYFGLVKLR